DPVEARHVLCLFLLQRRAENAREITDDLGVQEVVLHEPLDGRKSRMRRIAEPLCDLSLNIEMQPLLRLPRQEMHVASHCPQEVFSLRKLAELAAGENSLIDQFLCFADAVVVLADPEERVQVAKAALAVLDVGINHSTAFALLRMTGITLGELCLDELGAGNLDELP